MRENTFTQMEVAMARGLKAKANSPAELSTLIQRELGCILSKAEELANYVYGF